MTGSTSSHDTWRPGFHLLPPTGWVNDPNGLCQYKGVYHVFCQCSPDWPATDAARGWGHFASRDLVRWEWQGMALMPDTPDDASGAYSGSAFIGTDGLMHLVYTGNVKLPGDHDYITSGRLANEIEVTSADGGHLSEKRTMLRNADYPDWCSNHVRDPKVWEQDGALHMLLGARDLDSAGAALVYRSDDDGKSWSLEEEVRPAAGETFGYMWECPDHLSFDGHEYLAFCPQGLAHERGRFQNVYQSGYLPLEGRLLDADATADDGAPLRHVDVTAFREWDMGFDFYAPQTFTADDGRTILVGWVGLPDIPYDNPTTDLGWMHCLTVPRELTRADDGTILQTPVHELEQLRGDELAFHEGTATSDTDSFDLEVTGITGDAWQVELVALHGCTLSLAYADGRATLTLDGPASAGRTCRRAQVGQVKDLRILCDRSVVEIYLDGGACVMTTRWYPSEPGASIHVRCGDASYRAWAMNDVMTEALSRA